MKRILLIAPQYYPCNSPCSYRIHSFAKYLPKYGYSPTILTLAQREDMVWNLSYPYDAGLEGLDVCRTERMVHPWPSASSSNLFRMNSLPLTWPPGLVERMVTRAEELHHEEPYDVILATAPLWFTLSVASGIGRQNSIPWIGDLRDIAGEHKLKINWRRPWQLRYWVYRSRLIHQEAKICRTAVATTTVSAHLADWLVQRGIPNVHVVTNGFDPDDYAKIPRTKSKVFRIVYAGGLCGGADPTPFFNALDLMLENKAFLDNDFEVCFYGKSPESVERHLRGHLCASIVRLEGLKSRREIQSITVNATLLLQLAYIKEKGLITSKIFEYLGAARPILAVPSDGDVIDDLLVKTGAGISRSTPLEIADAIGGFYAEWKKTGQVAYSGNTQIISQYSRQSQALILSKVLDQIVRS